MQNQYFVLLQLIFKMNKLKEKSNYEKMDFNKNVTTWMSIFMFIPFLLVSQTETSEFTEKGVSNTYKKIKLDGKVAYVHSETGKVLSKSEYFVMHGTPSHSAGHGHSHDDEFDHFKYYWESDKVNPYKDVVVTTPFKIEFDQNTFTHPVDHEIEVTSRYGRRKRRPHRGIDLNLVTGDNVRTVLPGKVRFVGYSSGHGKTVIVRHVNEIETVYAHLSDYKVKENDIVSEGQIIGLGGNTGRSTGSHLHLEVRYKGVCIHPEYVFNFDGSRTIRGSELWVSNAWKTPRFHSAYKKSEVTCLHTQEDAIASEKAEPRYHKVRSGDTLGHIARRHHLGVSEICKLNRIRKTSTLKIGQILRVR